MPTLRLTQTKEESKKYKVEIALEGDSIPRQTATAYFDFNLSLMDQERIRWYLEEFLQYPQEPALSTAEGVEKQLSEIGTRLFKELFHSSDDARDLWAMLRTRLNDKRVKIVTSVQEAASIPWELLRDPNTARINEFMRATQNTTFSYSTAYREEEQRTDPGE